MAKILLNEKTLLTWREIDESNWKIIVCEIAKLFFSAGIVQMEQLKSAWHARNLDGVRQASHSLKSSCGNVGAVEAHSLLDRIESACASNDMKRVTTLMTDLDPVFSQSCLQLSDFVKTLQAA